MANWAQEFEAQVAGPSIAALRRDFAGAGLSDTEWHAFRVRLSGDAYAVASSALVAAQRLALDLQGRVPTPSPDDTAPYVRDDADLAVQPVELLIAEENRLKRLAGLDAENARRLRLLGSQINELLTTQRKVTETLEHLKGSDERLAQFRAARRKAYGDVFAALLTEEAILRELYRPLAASLAGEGGALGEITFVVRRKVNIAQWATAGEELLDLRKAGKFKGRGALAAAAEEHLLVAWRDGDAAGVASAMDNFVSVYEESLLEQAAVDRANGDAFHDWVSRLANWLYGTDHVQLAYSIQFGGIEVERLSPGTRGIVLLLLYLAIDREDDRPLIIDQPEENLDPKSIFDELVGRFREVKRRRQMIVVTHNANLVVNTDADQVIVAECDRHSADRLPDIRYVSGGLENPVIRAKVCEILEGGEAAFRERAKRLRFAIG